MKIRNGISTIAQKVESLVNTFLNLPQNPQPKQEPSVPKAVQVEQHDAPRDEPRGILKFQEDQTGDRF